MAFNLCEPSCKFDTRGHPSTGSSSPRLLDPAGWLEVKFSVRAPRKVSRSREFHSIRVAWRSARAAMVSDGGTPGEEG